MVAPLIIGMVWGIINQSDAIMPLLRVYLLLPGIALIIYMVCALRQYGSWLRDNYADLEHKEVWQSFVVLTVILLIFGIYVLGIKSSTHQYIIQINDIVLVCYLLWRVETISDLSSPQPLSLDKSEESYAEGMMDTDLSTTTQDKIGLLLQRHCIDTQIYLQHDLTISQLAQAIGTNRFYLSQYFSLQGTTYNAYINGLRIDHFVGLYSEAITTRRTFTAQQLAHESGYRSYSTFGIAFKQRMGQTVTAWMRDTAKKPTV